MKYITSLLTFLTVLTLQAQLVSDQVALGAGYQNQSFYSMTNGEVALVDNTNWDIAFTADGFSSSVIINDNTGASVYLYGEVSQWSSVDTTGMSSWDALLNSDSDWAKGAFIAPQDESNAFDYGWGIYNPVTHIVTGDRLYIVSLASGDVKKLRIDGLNFGAYTFTYADLDGSNEVEETVNVADYPERNFFYYSMTTGEFTNREPAIDSWDITFTRYIEELPFAGNYLVTGALSNPSVTVAEARNVAVEDAVWTDYQFNSDISEMGSDWKMFDQTIFQYDIEEDLTYFVQDIEGNVWRLIFTGFTGSSEGLISFDKEMMSVVGLDEEKSFEFDMFPNPAQGEVNIIFPLDNESANIEVIDMAGRVVFQHSVNGGLQHILPLDGLDGGTYVLRMTVDGVSAQRTLILN